MSNSTTTEFKPRVWGQSGTGPWDKNVSLLNFYQVLPPLPSPWIGGRGSGARDSGVNLLSPPKDKMDQTQLIWDWRPSWGQGKGPRKSQAPCWLLSSRQLAPEGARNNPDSWGGGAMDTGERLKSGHLEAHTGC